MASTGGFTAEFLQDVMERVVRKSTADLTASTMHVHLYNVVLTDAVTNASTGRTGATGAADNYDSKKWTNSTAFWTAPTATSPSLIQNKSGVTFTTSASTGWGTIKGFTVTSASATGSGVIYFYLNLPSSAYQTVAAGHTVQISTGALVMSIGGGTNT